MTTKYRWKNWVIATSFASLAVPTALFLPGILLANALYALSPDENVLLRSIGLSLLVFMLLSLLTIYIYSLARLAWSHLIISADGGEYRMWPTHGLRFAWEDVIGIVERNQFGLIKYKALELSKADFAGPALGHRMRRKFNFATQLVVPLNGFRGWPGGPLEADIRSRAPRLFNDVDGDAENASNNTHDTGTHRQAAE